MDTAVIKEQLEKNALNSIIFVGVDDLDYLKRGGRITPAAAAMGSVLNIKPLLVIGGDKINAYQKGKGIKNYERRLLKAMQERTAHFKSQGLRPINMQHQHPRRSECIWNGSERKKFP